MKKTFLSSVLHFILAVIILLIVLNAGVFIYSYLQDGHPSLFSPAGQGGNTDFSGLHSRNMILVNLDSGEELAQQNSDERIYPASMTKMMTAILAIEYTSDLDEWTTMPEDIYSKLYIQDASMAGFEAGESVSYRDVLYGILLPSGCECCEAFAEWIYTRMIIIQLSEIFLYCFSMRWTMRISARSLPAVTTVPTRPIFIPGDLRSAARFSILWIKSMPATPTFLEEKPVIRNTRGFAWRVWLL